MDIIEKIADGDEYSCSLTAQNFLTNCVTSAASS